MNLPVTDVNTLMSFSAAAASQFNMKADSATLLTIFIMFQNVWHSKINKSPPETSSMCSEWIQFNLKLILFPLFFDYFWCWNKEICNSLSCFQEKNAEKSFFVS